MIFIPQITSSSSTGSLLLWLAKVPKEIIRVDAGGWWRGDLEELVAIHRQE